MATGEVTPSRAFGNLLKSIPAFISTIPPSPKVGTGLPVFASREISQPSTVP